MWGLNWLKFRSSFNDEHHRILSRVVASTNEMVIITDAEGYLVWANESFYRITEYTPEEMAGRRPGSLLQGLTSDQETIQSMRAGIRSGQGFHVEIVNYTKSGRAYWVEIECKPIFDPQGSRTHFMAIERDISIRRAYQEMLELTSERLLRAETISNLGSWTYNVLTNEVWWSDQIHKIFQRPPHARTPSLEEIQDYIHEEDRAKHAAAVEKAIKHGVGYRLDFRIVFPDGVTRWLHGIGEVKRSALGDVNELFGTVQDVTEARLTSRELTIAKEEAEAATKAKSQFLAMMSHEIRTPMNAILGFADLLLQSELSDQQRDYMETIQRSGKALLDIINDILDFSKIESSRLELEKHPTDIREIARDVMKLLGPMMQEKKLEAHLDLAADLPTLIKSDPIRLRQVLINLVSNATKFTQQGRISLRATVDVLGPFRELRIEVRDTGIGIPKAQQYRLFQVFSQVDVSTNRKFGGTGLGLAISRRIVELMGGRIWVESEEGKGACFICSFPFEEIESIKNAELKSFGSEVANSFANLRVLLAEDNEVNVKLAKIFIEKLGCHVDVATNGREAIELNRKNAYDIVYMDLQMPEVDGLEATKQIRKDDIHSDVYIVAMTASTMLEDQEAAKAAGMNDFISKPISIAAIEKSIENYRGAKSPDLSGLIYSAQS